MDPTSSKRPDSSSSTPFPSITVRDLEGRTLSFPGDLAIRSAVAIVAFQRDHQALVDSWVSWLEQRARHDPAFSFFEIPAISGRWSIARSFIDGGMARAIVDPIVLRRTLTFYGRLDQLTEPLGITDRTTISVIALGANGTVRGLVSGGFDARTAERLGSTLDPAS